MFGEDDRRRRTAPQPSPPVWLPRLPAARGPAYLAIVEALAADLAAGVVQGGARLLPQRDMAERLGLSAGTVAKAYAEAARRGLIAGTVGRGTFVSTAPPAAPAAPAPVNMSLNVPPETGSAAVIAAALAEVARDDGLAGLLGYLPHMGLPAHRAAMADWLAREAGLAVAAGQVALCNGAQHAIALALMAALAPGEPVLAEALTYPGVVGIAARLGHALHAVAIDAEGLIPEAVDAAFAATGARALYCMPTLQTPTGAVLGPARRAALASVLRRHDAWAIEDDVYGFLAPESRPPLAALAPERVCYVSSLAKCVAPGLRIGALVVPEALRPRLNGALRATGWMASPLLAAVAARLLASGAVAGQIARKRAAAAERWHLARDLLRPHLDAATGPPAFHVWLALTRPPADLVAEAALRGVVLASPAAIGPAHAAGVRLCLGGAPGTEDLRRGLRVIAAILGEGEGRALV